MTSRRHFLQLVGGAGLGLAGCQADRTDSTARAQDRSTEAPPSIPPDRVVIARDLSVIQSTGVDPQRLAAMLEAAMAALSPAGDAGGAWRALFQPSDTVAVKVNCLAGPPLSSHPELVAAVAQAIHSSVGIAEERIVVYDRDSAELKAAGFDRSGRSGYRCRGTDETGYDAEPTTVFQAGSCYSRIVSEQATAIVNVPVLKDHDLAGLTGALKNHFGSIHNPNKLHTDRCTPYVADINCAPCIRGKHRLVVCDALLVCYDGGPGYKPDTTKAYGAVLVSADPVAADTVGFSLIEELRKQHGLAPITGSEREPRYLQVAADEQHDLGIADLEKVDLVEVDPTGLRV